MLSKNKCYTKFTGGKEALSTSYRIREQGYHFDQAHWDALNGFSCDVNNAEELVGRMPADTNRLALLTSLKANSRFNPIDEFWKSCKHDLMAAYPNNEN